MGDGGIDFISNPNWGFINPIYTCGIYRSTNRGETWVPINSGFITYFQNTGTCRRMIINPQNSNQLFVATSSGIFRTNNALEADPVWTRLTVGLNLNDEEYRGLEFMPGNSNTIYASGKDIYRSIDNGDTWQNITTLYGFNIANLPNCIVNRINLTVTPDDPSRLYAYIEGTYVCPSTGCTKAQVIYIYMFKNNSWVQLHTQNNHRPDHTADPFEQPSPSWLGFAASPIDANQLFFGYTYVKGCRDVTQNPPVWNDESPYLCCGYHADCHALVFQPNVSINPKLFAGTHGGLSVKTLASPPNSEGWVTKYNGLNNSLIWSFDVSKMRDGYFIAGLQCDGIKVRDNGTSTWITPSEGDGYGAQIAFEENPMSFVSVNGRLYRHKGTDTGLGSEHNYRPYDPNPPNPSDPRVQIPNTFQVHKHLSEENPMVGFTELFERKKKFPGDPGPDLWEGESDIYKFGSPRWARQITEFAIAPSNKDTIYVVIGGQIHPTWGIVEPQLYRTTSGGNNGNYSIDKFENLTNFLPVIPGISPIAHPIITGIAISPDKADKIWLTFTGYYPTLKVYYSEDGGLSWTNADPNGTLENIPVNGIVYQEGTNDRLYIATDVGVYVRENANSDWERYGNIPNIRVTELKINPCTGKLSAATFGRGIWEADLLPSEQVVHQIYSNETWSNTRILENSFAINAPCTLTITNTIYMPKDARIIVKPGAQLILDGGKITQNCDCFWYGIELWGDAELSQIPMTNQGKIHILNGGTIENAAIGILVGKRSDEDYNQYDPAYGGGLIWCTNGNFINNRVGVLFTPYDDINHSFFRQTNFTTNAILPNSSNPDSFVKVYGTNMVKFYGCSFQKERNWNEAIYAKRGTGINSDNSRVLVSFECLSPVNPCTQILPCLFEGLTRGIYSTNSGSANDVAINHTNFYDNVKGLYLSGFSEVSHVEITENAFRVFRPGEEWIDCYGMYLNECSGYHVEQNEFFSEGTPYDGISLIVNNSIINDEELEVYRNTFTNLMYGSLAQHTNRNAVTLEGLCYKCNKFIGNYCDIATTKDPQAPVAMSFGIAENQGSDDLFVDAPAGNIFQVIPPINHYDINNAFSNINYYYHGINNSPYRLDPTNWTIGIVSPVEVPIEFIEEEACPSTLNGGGGSGEDYIEMDYAKSQADSLNVLLTSLIDGGSTEILYTEVETSTPPEALETYNELLATSPYVSDSVMKTSIEKEEVLDNSMIRDVMVANTHSAKSDELVNMLENRAVPMPDYMMAEILQGEDSINAKESLEATRAYWNSKRSESYHKIIRYFRESIASQSANDSLVTLLKQRNTLGSWYSLVAWYAGKAEYDSVSSTLNQIASSFILSPNDLIKHQYFVSLYNILKQISLDSMYVYNLDSINILLLTNIYTTDDQLSGAYARNLILAAGKTTYDEPIVLPEGSLKSSKRDKYRGVKPPPDLPKLKVYPNPAKDYFIVEYHLDYQPKDCFIKISDLAGREITKLSLHGKDDQKIISIIDYPSGTYIISLFIEGKNIDNVKISLMRL